MSFRTNYEALLFFGIVIFVNPDREDCFPAEALSDFLFSCT